MESKLEGPLSYNNSQDVKEYKLSDRTSQRMFVAQAVLEITFVTVTKRCTAYLYGNVSSTRLKRNMAGINPRVCR